MQMNRSLAFAVPIFYAAINRLHTWKHLVETHAEPCCGLEDVEAEKGSSRSVKDWKIGITIILAIIMLTLIKLVRSGKNLTGSSTEEKGVQTHLIYNGSTIRSILW